jgi:hypothetical protein
MSMLVSNYSGLTVFTHSDCHQCFMLIENQYREGTLCPLVEHQSDQWISYLDKQERLYSIIRRHKLK